MTCASQLVSTHKLLRCVQYKAKARCAYTATKDRDIHENERSCPKPDLSSINVTNLGVDRFRVHLAVRDEPPYATPPPKDCQENLKEH